MKEMTRVIEIQIDLNGLQGVNGFDARFSLLVALKIYLLFYHKYRACLSAVLFVACVIPLVDNNFDD